jgi:hypothetical protein
VAGCYVGCWPVTPNASTVDPFHPAVLHLAMTGAGSGLHGLLLAGVITLVAGTVALVADHQLRKSKPK